MVWPKLESSSSFARSISLNRHKNRIDGRFINMTNWMHILLLIVHFHFCFLLITFNFRSHLDATCVFLFLIITKCIIKLFLLGCYCFSLANTMCIKYVRTVYLIVYSLTPWGDFSENGASNTGRFFLKNMTYSSLK